MRYHYEKPKVYLSMYGSLYICEHPLYNSCTLFRIDNKGLAVIQQRFNSEEKRTWWTEVDSWLTDAIYLHSGFKAYFDERAGASTDGLYPTVTVRQIMWALKMKPIPKERWETVFDRRDI
jgi:hypothetical protein